MCSYGRDAKHDFRKVRPPSNDSQKVVEKYEIPATFSSEKKFLAFFASSARGIKQKRFESNVFGDEKGM